MSRQPYSKKAAAAYLRMSVKSIDRLMQEGVLRSVRLTRNPLIPACDVEGLVERLLRIDTDCPDEKAGKARGKR